MLRCLWMLVSVHCTQIQWFICAHPDTHDIFYPLHCHCVRFDVYAHVFSVTVLPECAHLCEKYLPVN